MFSKDVKLTNSELAKANQAKKVGIAAAWLFVGASLLLIASDSLDVFDLAVAARAAFDPVITFVTDYFGKVVAAVCEVGTWC